MERSPTGIVHKRFFVVSCSRGFVASMAMAVGVVAICVKAVFAQSPTYGVGRAPTAAELKAIDIEVTPDGKGLVPGSGTAAAGKEVYARRCETCHGPTGAEGPPDVLAGGHG